jgi:glutathione S-transferase
MLFTLVGISHSVCTLRPLLVLAEKGVSDFTLHAPNIAAGEHKVSEHDVRTYTD